ncbi:hypothetical protein [Nonomuraea sp. NPDC049750]|uniref:hypothetical protein n=1 Tax=Nonomuraea sp. NPDC049750 TaxID=3154738 RepID=UPI0033C0705F
MTRLWYLIGLLLIVSGLVHLGVLVVDGGPWDGPVSWRKPFTFGVSFGLSVLSLTWVSQFIQLRRRNVLLGLFAVASVMEVALISVQAWRGVPSHFNMSTDVDSLIARTLAAGGFTLIAVAIFMTISAFRPSHPDTGEPPSTGHGGSPTTGLTGPAAGPGGSPSTGHTGPSTDPGGSLIVRLAGSPNTGLGGAPSVRLAGSPSMGLTGTSVVRLGRSPSTGPGGSPSMRLAVQAGFGTFLAAMAFGGIMIARGVVEAMTGSQQLAYTVAGSLKSAHAILMHGVLLLPALAWLLSRTHPSEQTRLRVVRLAIETYITVSAIVSALALFGITIVSPSTASVLCAGAISGLAIVALTLGTLLRPQTHSPNASGDEGT